MNDIIDPEVMSDAWDDLRDANILDALGPRAWRTLRRVAAFESDPSTPLDEVLVTDLVVLASEGLVDAYRERGSLVVRVTDRGRRAATWPRVVG